MQTTSKIQAAGRPATKQTATQSQVALKVYNISAKSAERIIKHIPKRYVINMDGSINITGDYSWDSK